MTPKKVMVFGTFDSVHEGHRAFFRQARTHGDYLIAVVAQDHIVKQLKGRLPAMGLEERFRLLAAEDGVDEVVVGDPVVGAWSVIKERRPEVIAVGYDQTALKEDLMARLKDFDWKPEIVVMQAHEPQKYHSSKLAASQ